MKIDPTGVFLSFGSRQSRPPPPLSKNPGPASGCVVDSGPTRGTEHFGLPPPPPVFHDWVIKGIGMSSRVCATGRGQLGIYKIPCHLSKKRRGLSPGGRFPPSFIHQVIIITGLNKLLYVLALKMASVADWA